MSSSKLLEQAIVDAQTLRDVAFKSAQATLLEKYAPQIKEAVQKLLEQDEEIPGADTASPTDALAGGQSTAPLTDFGGAPADPTNKSTVAGTANKLPLAATDGEKLCKCPDEDEEVEVELDLAALAAQLSGDTEEEDTGALPTGMMDQPQAMGGNTQLQEELELEELELEGIELEEDLTEISLEEILSADDSDGKESEESEDSEEEESTQIKNKSAADLNKDDKLSPYEKARGKAIEKSMEKQKTNESTTKQLMSTSAKLLREHQNTIKLVEKKDMQIQKLLEENKKFSSTIEQMSNVLVKLDEVNLTNAKLFYSNQILKSASLNERQKNHIVDAVSKTDNVNEAKTVYETLISSMGGPSEKDRSPKSLNEAISKGSSFRLPHKQSAEKPDDSNKDRWLKLAGIK
jgi:myosin heavy subunit